MPYFTIDRFEDNGWAVLEREDEETFNVPKDWLPKGASEGDVLCVKTRTGRKEPWSSVRFYLDSEEKERRVEQTKNLRASIPKGPEGDIEL